MAPISPVGGAIIFGTSVCAIRVILAIVCVWRLSCDVLGSRHNKNNNNNNKIYRRVYNNIFSCLVCGGDYVCTSGTAVNIHTTTAAATLPRRQILIVPHLTLHARFKCNRVEYYIHIYSCHPTGANENIN